MVKAAARWAPAWTATAAAVVALGAVALAPPASAQPLGALTQARGKTGCVSESAKPKCGRGRGLAGATTSRVLFVTASADGRNVYATGDAVGIFSRDRRSGRLRQLRGREGCVSRNGDDGCATGRGLDFTRSLALSADGRNAYVTSADGVSAFRRNRSSGALTQLEGEAGCISGAARAGCALARGLEFPIDVSVSSDGRNVYVGSYGGVVVFARDPATGTITQLPAEAGCIRRPGPAGCAILRVLETPISLAGTPGGGSIYVVDPNDEDVSGLAVLRRDRFTGALTQLPGEQGCLGREAGCADARALAVPASVVASPEGRNVYVVGRFDFEFAGDVAAFSRSRPDGALTQLRGKAGCASLDATPRSGCALIRTIFSPSSLAISRDGRSAYLAGGSGSVGAVAVLARRASGKLSQVSGRAGCVRQGGGEGCTKARALKDARSVAVSPDGSHVYVASASSASIAVFTRNRGER